MGHSLESDLTAVKVFVISYLHEILEIITIMLMSYSNIQKYFCILSTSNIIILSQAEFILYKLPWFPGTKMRARKPVA
jgi:hypothetical protein